MTVSECAKLLGEAIAKDEAVLAFNAAKKAYEENEAITKAINEYNAQRMIGKYYALQFAEKVATTPAWTAKECYVHVH